MNGQTELARNTERVKKEELDDGGKKVSRFEAGLDMED